MTFAMRSLRTAFEARSLRSQLSLLIALCAALTAVLGMVAVAGTAWWMQTSHAQEDSTGVARTLAYALEAPVAFDDAKGITDALALLRAYPDVNGAWVYNGAGTLLSRYGSAGPQPPAPGAGGLAAGYLQIAESITNDGRVIGRVVLVQQLSRLWQSLAIAMLAIALCSLAGFAVSVWLAQRVATAITRPIATLAQASRDMAIDPDHSARLPEVGSDEISTAVHAFNQMLDEIGRRGGALRAANSELEARVAERTQALQLETERARAASLAKTRFLANMSHELRTPLNAVIGAAQLLHVHEEHLGDQAHLVDAIRGSGLSLLGLIENVLDISRIETGSLELVPEDFNLLDCVEAAVATASVTARAKGLALACIFDPKLPVWRHGDHLRLRQVLLNLLGNAVKFTLAGEVVLRVQAGDVDGAVQFKVSDTGIGIGAASLGKIFEPFRQADDRSNRRFGGSGLGLAISRQLVEAMGGRLSVCSTLGEGSTFEAALVLPPAQAETTEPPPLGRTVLVFEPHEASAQALVAQLQRLGCEATRCETPREVREWMRERPVGAPKPWLLVAVDAAQTWEVLDEASHWIDPERVIGMTESESHAAEVARERFHVPRNVIKPVLRSALVSRLGATGCAPVPVAPTPAVATSKPEAQAHVLVVEDDRVNQTIVCAMLHNAGYAATVAAGGEQAIALLTEARFDLVLMDWQMPDMDGLEVTRRLRAGAAGRHGRTVPIVALTANAFAEDRAACMAAGMDDFLTKPVLAASLQATLARWIGAGNAPGRDARTGAATTIF